VVAFRLDARHERKHAALNEAVYQHDVNKKIGTYVQKNEQKSKSAKVLRMRKNRFAIPDRELQPIGLAIQAKRLELNLSQEALAEKAKLHRTYISLIERKSCNISMRIFMELAQALELGPTELLELASSLVTPKKKKS